MSNGPKSLVNSRWQSAKDWIGRPIRWMRQALRASNPVGTRITREGAQFYFMIAFILVGAILKNVNLLVFLAGTLWAMLLIQWRVCSRTMLNLSVERRLPRSIHARRPFEIELILRNPKRWLGAWWVLVQDRMVFSPIQTTIHRASQAISLLFMSVPPGTSRSQRYRCVAERRGRYQLMGIEMTTRFPFGLFRGILNQKGAVWFTVQPALGRLLPPWMELFHVRYAGARQRRARALSDEGEFFGLRAYRPGDSPRWIHWRSSARRDELVVKQFQQPENRELIILLDLAIPSDTSEETRLAYIKIEDKAVEFLATLVHRMTHGNLGSITIAIADSVPTLASRVTARAQGYALLDRLGNARGGSKPTTSHALRLLEREHRHVEHLIVISTRSMPSRWSEETSVDLAPFWRSIQWIDASSGGTDKYFAPAE